MFEFLRKFSLLMILFVVAMGTYLSAAGATDWKETLWVQVYPMNGDGLETTDRYIATLKREDFSSIDEFMRTQAGRYRVAIETPVKVYLGPEVSEFPPAAPFGGNFLEIGYWSLKLRWWARSVTSDHSGPTPDIKLFVMFYDPEQSSVLEHSLGLQKGRIGVVKVFAAKSQSSVNNFVIAHEMLHTLGATDKYSGPFHLPAFPSGYADPNKNPLYPQTKAEIMGGRIALSEISADMPRGLREANVGTDTAQEIRWIR